MSERIEFRLAGQRVADKAYHYKQSGLDNVYLLNGFEREITSDGPVTSIENMDGLHLAIGLRLVLDTETLSPKAIRYLRREMDLTQDELGAKIGISSQMVARWEKGLVEIGGPSERILRVLYIMSKLPEHAQGEVMEAFVKLVDYLNKPAANVCGMRKPKALETVGLGWKAEAAEA